ncbi:EF-hand calcium-binding domain-containing protein 14 [Aplochiton taeniatus]
MKKRKELNALIGLGDSKRTKTKKGSGHRLLRTEPPDSESESSSDDDEFNNLGTVTAFGKRSYTQCCNFCYPLFLFIILAACVMACAGLLWMQIALKEDLDTLKEKLHTMESSQKVSSHEIPKLSEDLKNKQRKLEDLESGDKGLSKLWSNLTEMNRKISLLDSAVSHLKASIKSASDLINLPTTVEELQKSVATVGSTLTTVQHDVMTMQTALETKRKEADDLKKTMDVTELRQAVSEANHTQELYHSWADEQIHTLHSSVSSLTQRLSSLEGKVSSTGANLLIITEEATPPTASKPTRRPRFLMPGRSKRNSGTGNPKKVSLPGVSSLKDLEELFQRAGPGSLGLTYQDIRKICGSSTPDAHSMERYDKDGDHRYSLRELRVAVGV